MAPGLMGRLLRVFDGAPVYFAGDGRRRQDQGQDDAHLQEIFGVPLAPDIVCVILQEDGKLFRQAGREKLGHVFAVSDEHPVAQGG